MESETFYLQLLPHVRGDQSERAKLVEILERISPLSTERAAYQLLHLVLIKDKHPDIYATVKGILDRLKAGLFNHMRLRTTMACLAVMGSHWSPERGMIASIQKLVEDSLKANAGSPVYQIFFRAVDYRWDEMVRVGAGLGAFNGSSALEMKIGDVTQHSAKVWVSGADAGAVGGFVLPGFLRGAMSVLGVSGSVEITEDDTDFIEILGRW